MRDLLDEAALRVAGLADWLESRRAAASDDPAELLSIVNRNLSPSRRVYDYWQANRHASDAYDTVRLIAECAAQAAPGLILMIERAISLATRAILKSDYSSGAQGNLIRTLLDAHAEVVRSSSPALAQAEQARLVKWIVKYRYDGKQDFFDPDIVAYAPGLSEKSIEQYRRVIGQTDLGEYGTYPLQRLAVLDRDRDAIIAARGGEPTNVVRAQQIVDDLEEAGPHDDAVTYARIGIGFDGRLWDSKLVTFLVYDALARGDAAEAVTLRRDWFARYPVSSSFSDLRKTADAVGEWERERPDAERRLAERSPDDFARYLLDEGRIDEAWEFATAHVSVGGSQSLWLSLCEKRMVTAPADTLPVYRQIVLGTLEVTDKRNYHSAAQVLKQMRDAAAAAGAEAEFEVFLAEVVEQNRRRPTCIEIFRKAKLVARA